MSSETAPAPRVHLVAPGETLVEIARRHGLPGWQALYFWDGNLAFRDLCPDPWRLEAGVSLAIPALPAQADKLRAGLDGRLRRLDRVRREARQLLDRQCAALRDLRPAVLQRPIHAETSQASSRSAGAPTADPSRRPPEESTPRLTSGPPSPDPALLTPLVRTLVDTTLEAIQLIKAGDTGMSRANWGLARDAIGRHPPVDTASGASLLTLLARAAEGAVWGIPEPAARAWCDSRSPIFWGQALGVALQLRADLADVAGTLEPACRQAGESVLRALDRLHGEAVEEAGRLARVWQAAQPVPDLLQDGADQNQDAGRHADVIPPVPAKPAPANPTEAMSDG